PSDPRTYRVAAFYYLMTGTWGRFDETMQRLAANEPDDADLLYLRALEAFKRHERRDETRAFLQRALSVNPELVRAQAKLVLIQDDIAASHAELVQLRALAPEHPVVRITGPIIDAEYELSRSFERARDGGASSTPAPPPAP
ncbi:MAG TPA: hypothetical protein VGQ57_20030, partial [Polyangiaceae bacterium]|nr:hypothetical protein [Polyangiaceae bacterium]